MGISSVLSILSTVISILLSIVSIGYTFLSGRTTLHNLGEMKEQNDILVNRLRQELSTGNFGKENIDNVEKIIDTQ